ncbi:hypothetical protein ABT187_00025 [Streptomyces sp. NPDC001817]|uniref:hypothetical protein n=1 Tax=Streptomyces sp. NPDC001817 TaxID=3154398 RepID=UPI0033226F0F
MELHEPPPRTRQPEGCLTVAIRVPLRIVVLVLVVPVRMAWDVLVATGRFLRDTVLRLLGRALLWAGTALFVRPLAGLWRHALVPVGRALARLGTVLVVVPAAWVYARVLSPVGHAVTWLLRGIATILAAAGNGVCTAVTWLARYLLVVPARWLYDRVLTPVGRAVARCARGLGWLLGMIGTGIGVALYGTLRVLLVLPALALWRWVLAPVGRFLAVVAYEVGDALGHAWRIAGRISRAVGRALATLFRWIFVEPLRRVYRTVLTPVGHLVRDAVLRPAAEGARVVGRAVREALAGARDTVRQARADLRRMLFGDPGQPAPVDRRELQRPATRSLGSSTTALTKD